VYFHGSVTAVTGSNSCAKYHLKQKKHQHRPIINATHGHVRDSVLLQRRYQKRVVAVDLQYIIPGASSGEAKASAAGRFAAEWAINRTLWAIVDWADETTDIRYFLAASGSAADRQISTAMSASMPIPSETSAICNRDGLLKAFIVQERRVAQSPDGGTICSAIDAWRLALVGRGPMIRTAVFSLNSSVFCLRRSPGTYSRLPQMRSAVHARMRRSVTSC